MVFTPRSRACLCVFGPKNIYLKNVFSTLRGGFFSILSDVKICRGHRVLFDSGNNNTSTSAEGGRKQTKPRRIRFVSVHPRRLIMNAIQTGTSQRRRTRRKGVYKISRYFYRAFPTKWKYIVTASEYVCVCVSVFFLLFSARLYIGGELTQTMWLKCFKSTKNSKGIKK